MEGTSEIDMVIINSLKWKNKNEINEKENNTNGMDQLRNGGKIKS